MRGFSNPRDFQRAHREWVDQAMANGAAPREERWSEALAVWSLAFVEKVKNDLGFKAAHREVLEARRICMRCASPVKLILAIWLRKQGSKRGEYTFVE